MKGENSENVGNLHPTVANERSEATTTTTTWKLEDSSIWWIGYLWDPENPSGLHNNPGNALLLTSVPFFAGAYFGYRVPTEQLEDLIQGGVGGRPPSETQRTTATPVRRPVAADQDAIKAVAARTASKALRIATLGTVGTFGFVGAMGFYMSGYRSLAEAVEGTTTWASSWSKAMEQAVGGDQALSKTHPDVLATKHMKEEEQLSYVYDKYIKEECNEEEDALWTDDDEQQRKEEAVPTLYSVYEKYFKKKENN